MTADYPYQDIQEDPKPSGLYPSQQVDLYAGSFTAFFEVVAIPSINKSMGGTLRIIGLFGQGILMQWEDPVGGRVWECEFVGRGLKNLMK